MTEDEARAKWCPLSRTGSNKVSGFSHNRESNGETAANSNCIASDCMAWRAGPVVRWPYLDGEPLPEGAEIHPKGRPVEWRNLKAGYCGLAGDQ